MDKMISTFGFGVQEIEPSINSQGGKGAKLYEMSQLGLPVPPGIIIHAEHCVEYMTLNNKFAKVAKLSEVSGQAWERVGALIDTIGKPALFSVRSGARVSMPGMMDTVLNIGINPDNIDYWEEELGARTAWDCYRRLIQMFGNVVDGIKMDRFEQELSETRTKYGCMFDHEIPVEGLKELVEAYKIIYKYHIDEGFQEDTETQIHMSIKAVWNSWNGARAIEYRKIHNIPDDWGTAVTIQQMVFGNANDDSCSGVAFTRNPATGENEFYGEFLVNAQGEDVVSGVRTPQPITEMSAWSHNTWKELVKHMDTLEKHFRDMQDIEFTVQSNKMFILQTRDGKRSSEATFVIALDMYNGGLLEKHEMYSRIKMSDYVNANKPTVDYKVEGEAVTTGIAAGGGVVTGRVAFTSQQACDCSSDCILVRKETTPDDIAGMDSAVGILTSTGGMTSHAAVVARGMNKSCVVGATDLLINEKVMMFDGKVISEDDIISIDGSTGKIWFHGVTIINEKPPVLDELDKMLFAGFDGPMIGQDKKDIIGMEISIPLRVFGATRINHWVVSIKKALQEGLKVHVDFDVPMSGVDESLFSFMGGITEGPSSYREEAEKALWDNDIYEQVIIAKAGSHMSLADYIKGVPAALSDEDIERIFGGTEALTLVKQMMTASGVKAGTVKKAKSKFEIISEVLG